MKFAVIIGRGAQTYRRDIDLSSGPMQSPEHYWKRVLDWKRMLEMRQTDEVIIALIRLDSPHLEAGEPEVIINGQWTDEMKRQRDM